MRYNHPAGSPPSHTPLGVSPRLPQRSRGFSLYAFSVARMPKPKAPPDLMRVLEDTADLLRERAMPDLAGDIEGMIDALRSMLQLTRHGDCLFGDEIRNILQIRHALRPRRGTDLDPMHGRRKCRRVRHRKPY